MKSWIKEIAVVLVIALVVSVILKLFIVQTFQIPSASMRPLLQEGDRVMVSKLANGPWSIHRGDVVVFKDPGGWLREKPVKKPSGIHAVIGTVLSSVGLASADPNEYLIKRVIGTEGDRVKCCDANGRLTVNGQDINETYVMPGSAPSETPFDIVVPKDSIWVMGDNRSNSADSRAHQHLSNGGAVKLDNVVGTAFVRMWPLNRFTFITNPGNVFADVPPPKERE